MIFNTALLFTLAIFGVHAARTVRGRGSGYADSPGSGSKSIVGNGIGNVGSTDNGGVTSPSLTTASPSSTVPTPDPYNPSSTADPTNCDQKCQGSNSFASDGQCYCAAESKKITDCLYKTDSFWPLLPAKTNASKCPSPVNDPAGYKQCIQDSLPQNDPNAQQKARDCVTSTGAQATA